MPEDRVDHALAQLDRSVTPDPGFREELFERLLEERERRPGLVRPRSIRRQRPLARKMLTIAAALGIAALAIAVVAMPFLRGGQRISADDVGPFGDMPPFRMVLERRIPAEMTRKYLGNVAEEYRLDRPSEQVLDRTIRLAISFDGEERWRIDYLDDSFYVPSGPLPPGSFEVFDGKRIMQYHADPGRFAFEEFFREAGWGVDDRANTYEVLDPGATPLGDLSWDASPGARRFWSGKCLEAEALGLAEIAGWTVQRIRCGPWDLWIDVETGLLLRRHLEFGVDGGPSSEDGVFGIFWGETQEVVELELDPTFSDDPFVFTPPEGSTSLKEFYERKPPTSLIVGDRVPAVELPLLGGGRFDLTSTRGAPTALYFWADWCEPCVGDPIETFDEVRAGSAGRAHLVSVATIADRGSVEAFVAEHALTVPVAFDHDGTVLNDMLQAEGIPLLLLVDADGRLSGAYLGGVSGEELRAILEAFVAGDPLPGGVAEKEQLPA